jgi:hypothetical protein
MAGVAGCTIPVCLRARWAEDEAEPVRAAAKAGIDRHETTVEQGRQRDVLDGLQQRGHHHI